MASAGIVELTAQLAAYEARQITANIDETLCPEPVMFLAYTIILSYIIYVNAIYISAISKLSWTRDRRNVLTAIGSSMVLATGYQKIPGLGKTESSPDRKGETAGGGEEIRITTASELRTAMNKAEPGNELVVEDGVYQFSSGLRPSAGGEEGNRILMRPAEGASPVIEFTGTEFGDEDSGIQIRGPYWTVRGLDVRGSTWKGMNVGGTGHDITFENLDVHDCHLWGIMNNGGDNVVFRNCVSHDNHDSENWGQNADGFNITGGRTGLSHRILQCLEQRRRRIRYVGIRKPHDPVLLGVGQRSRSPRQRKRVQTRCVRGELVERTRWRRTPRPQLCSV